MRIGIFNLHNMCEHNTLFLSRAWRYFELNDHHVIDGRMAGDEPDLFFIGGCAVTDVMRNRCEETIRKIMERHVRAQVVIFGCLAAFPEILLSLRSAENRLHLISFRESRRLDDLIRARIPFEGVAVNRLRGHVPYQPCMGSDDCYVLIAQGCVNACSYCTIKKAKGAVVSRPEAAIEAEVRGLFSRGIETVTLLADDCGSYGYDRGADLPSLLGRLCMSVPSMRFKIYTLFPSIFLRQASALERFFAQRRVPYLCLPVQSAASGILDLMNRRYDPAELAEAVARIRRLDPDLFVYTHFIYNFPTESWKDFEQSIAFARHFDHCVFIGYGENRGTRAAAIYPKCDDHALRAKTRHLEELVRGGQLSAFVVPRT